MTRVIFDNRENLPPWSKREPLDNWYTAEQGRRIFLIVGKFHRAQNVFNFFVRRTAIAKMPVNR